MQTQNSTDPDARQDSTTAAPAIKACIVSEQESPASEATGDDFRKLDVTWVGLTRCVHAIVFSVIDIVALVAGTALFWFISFPANLLIPAVWLVLGGISALVVVWWPRWEHERWSYRVRPKVVELRYGVIWHMSVSIPLSRLQHVDLHRGPLERRWGLATLEIHTAGTRDASHRIPGLDVATANTLRDQLIDAAHRGPHAAAAH